MRTLVLYLYLANPWNKSRSSLVVRTKRGQRDVRKGDKRGGRGEEGGIITTLNNSIHTPPLQSHEQNECATCIHIPL